MSKLEDLKPNTAVRGIVPDGLVTVVSVQWFGSEALELTYKTSAGKVACVVARRFRDPAAGAQAASGVVAHGLIRIVPLDETMLALATRLGSQQLLRGADALYAATAQVTGDVLVSWDNELIQRAGALSPTDWLDANP